MVGRCGGMLARGPASWPGNHVVGRSAGWGGRLVGWSGGRVVGCYLVGRCAQVDDAVVQPHVLVDSHRARRRVGGGELLVVAAGVLGLGLGLGLG